MFLDYQVKNPKHVVDVNEPLFTYLHPCKPCPSMDEIRDPESEDILTWPDCELAYPFLFPCAWRREVLDRVLS